MAGLGRTIANLGRVRRRFEKLLNAAPGTKITAPPSRLRELVGFGSNPGGLRLFTYVPEHLAKTPALVVALHGCTQTATGYDWGSGWSALADRCGFVVIYPEQQRANNPLNCFSWFLPGDTQRDAGEALSIREMIERAILRFGVDRQRVFVTGLSAGGAMAGTMLATYPEVFAGGAIIAGLPYGSATSAEEAFQVMRGAGPTSAHALGDRVRAASNHQGPWPRLSVWQGGGDTVVNPANADYIVAQWAHLHKLSSAAELEIDGDARRRVWKDAAGDTIIEAVEVAGMAHGLPLATGPHSCGAPGAFFLDVGISSTDHIAAFWGLQERPVLALSAGAHVVPVTTVLDAGDLGLQAPGTTDPAPIGAVEVALGSSDGAKASPIDPSAVIAAALKAAGIGHVKSGTTGHGGPGPIIEAALKAAGIMKR